MATSPPNTNIRPMVIAIMRFMGYLANAEKKNHNAISKIGTKTINQQDSRVMLPAAAILARRCCSFSSSVIASVLPEN